MTHSTQVEGGASGLEPIDDAIDHVRGGVAGRLIIEYGDYECPYTRAAYREIERVERRLGDGVRFAFRHFPLPRSISTRSPPPRGPRQPQSSSGSGRCITSFLRHQGALENFDLRRYAHELELDPVQFDRDRASAAVMLRVGRDVESGIASGQVRGTPTLFIDGIVHRGDYDAAGLLEALAR
jgi:protein-disulfide isomerase